MECRGLTSCLLLLHNRRHALFLALHFVAAHLVAAFLRESLVLCLSRGEVGGRASGSVLDVVRRRA